MLKNKLSQKIRLLSNIRKEPYLSFYKILGFYPDNISYYQLAVRHRSVAVPIKKGVLLSNERLEFLGDAVLSSAVADILYHQFEDKDEGFLTDARSKVVNRDVLNQMAFAIGLDKLLVYSKSLIFPEKSSIYGNALEALIGAIYLDYGYDKCKYFVKNKLFTKKYSIEKLISSKINFKSEIIEWSQKKQIDIKFDTHETEYGSYSFKTILYIKDKAICEGFGNNKKESQQNASKKAYKMINKNQNAFNKI